VTGAAPWRIILPAPERPDGKAPPRSAELDDLATRWRRQLVADRTYSEAHASALTDPARVCSWAPPPLHGPRITLALVNGKVIAGVELWQRRTPISWFLENLVRDQAPEFKGSGRAVVEAAMRWWRATYGHYVTEVRAHAMEGEPIAVGWWTEFLQRPPDFGGESIRGGGMTFPAVGWVVHSPPTRMGQAL